MDDLSDLFEIQVHPDVAEVLPLYAGLKSSDNHESLSELKRLADKGNKYACYVYGNLFVLGRMPRFYIFNKEYESGEVVEKAHVTLNERYGLSYLVKLLKMSNGEVCEFQLEGMYDLYKLVEGKAAFFNTNDLSCRPKNPQDPMFPLFNSVEKIQILLNKLNHYEVYIDSAKSLIERFKKDGNLDDIKKAVDSLNTILGDDLFCRFSIYDISEAHFQLGLLYLEGNEYLPKDLEIATTHMVSSRKDEALCILIDHYKKFDNQFINSIRRCVGLIKDDALRKEKYRECDIPEPAPTSIEQSLERLVNIKPKNKETPNFAFDFDEPQELVTPASEVETSPVLDEAAIAQRDEDVASRFEVITDSVIDDVIVSTIEPDFSGGDNDEQFMDEMLEPDDYDFPDD